jgi:hypothetical protein
MLQTTSSNNEIEIIIEKLGDKNLEISEVQSIYNTHRNDKEIVSHVAMNLSLRTSVYDRSQQYSPIMVELLSDLAQNPIDMSARWAVAKNPHTPVEILELLAKDDINLVRALVATNPNTPTHILDSLFSDEKIVRDGLSGNPNTSEKLLNILCDDSDKMVRLRLAENSAVPKPILIKLSKDMDIDVAKAAEIKLAELA